MATQGEGAQRAKGEVPEVRPSFHSCVLAQPRVPLTMGMGEGSRVTQSEPCLGRLPSVSQLGDITVLRASWISGLKSSVYLFNYNVYMLFLIYLLSPCSSIWASNVRTPWSQPGILSLKKVVWRSWRTCRKSKFTLWKIPWTEEPGGLQSMVLQESDMT